MTTPRALVADNPAVEPRCFHLFLRLQFRGWAHVFPSLHKVQRPGEHVFVLAGVGANVSQIS